ncbi:MAG: tyrosine-type recombinase/integrase [Steroidobacteraceae bacterium]
MPRRVFTETWIRSLKPSEARQDFTEAGRPGFMLRLWPGGQKTFVLRYSREGRAQVMTLGQWPAMSLAEAHDEHGAARKLLSRTIDPIEEREREAKARQVRERHEKITSGITTRNVAAEWAWHYARRHRKRPREAVRLARVYLATPWRERPAHELTKRDAVLLLDRLVARGSHVMARRVRSLGLQVFTFAVARDLVAVNPFIGTLPPGEDEEPRDRKLDASEVHAFWNALDRRDTEMSQLVRLGLRLILVTAQRPGEVAGAAWSEIDTERAVWTIPPERSKNGRAHEVPLSDLALELLEQLRAPAADRPHLLPSVHSKLRRGKPLSQRALSRALRNNHDDGKLFGLQPFTPHDLRRTAASMMTSLGILRLHVSKVLNHTDQDITGKVYDLNEYTAEKRKALQTWADHLRAVTAGKRPKVVPIAAEQRA